VLSRILIGGTAPRSGPCRLWGCHTPAKKTQERGPISPDRNPNAGIAEHVTNWDYYEKLRSKNIVKNVFLINSICPITVKKQIFLALLFCRKTQTSPPPLVNNFRRENRGGRKREGGQSFVSPPLQKKGRNRSARPWTRYIFLQNCSSAKHKERNKVLFNSVWTEVIYETRK
jgi:hypothetical protein